ncbi:MAG: substrate-binding domain-containing protein [Fimbriimonadaceae bacterium]
MASCDELGRRFAEAYSGKWREEAVNLDDPESYRVITSVPVAVLAKRSSEAKVREVFSSSNPWEELSSGKLRWSFANPLDSSSGTLVLGWALWGFAQTTQSPSDLTGLSNKAGFKNFLSKLKRTGFVDAPEGSKSHIEAFVSGILDADCVLNYASSLESAAASNPDYVLIYPSRTVFARHVFSVFNSGSETEQEGAKDFLRYLASNYPKMSVPSGVSTLSIPKYYPGLNNAELA